MASKRMKNRIYWAHVKAQAYSFKIDAITVDVLKQAYTNAFKHNYPDSMLKQYSDSLLTIESQFGPAGLRNVHNRDLWPVRERIAMSNA